MIILRLSRPTSLVTAEVFEELFAQQFGEAFDVRHADTEEWATRVLGPAGAPCSLDAAAGRIEAALEQADFLAPNYEAVPFVPLFLALRNRARLRTRLLLVAHAP